MNVMTFTRPKVVARLAALADFLERHPTARMDPLERVAGVGYRATARMVDELARRTGLHGPPAPKRAPGWKPQPAPFSIASNRKMIATVAAILRAEPSTSGRAIARQLAISQTTARRYVLHLGAIPRDEWPQPVVESVAPARVEVRQAATWFAALGA